MKTLVEQLRERTARVAQGGSESARTKHTDRGKMLARDRIHALLDPGSPFLELSPLAAYGMYGRRARTATTTSPCRAPASSPGSAGSRAASA